MDLPVIESHWMNKFGHCFAVFVNVVNCVSDDVHCGELKSNLSE